MNEATKLLALAGDSTVAAYKETEQLRGWGQVIGEYFKDELTIENHAACGRSTKTFIEENRWEELLKTKPDFILLQFGHNDSHAKGNPESTDAETDYKDFLRKYADESEESEIIFVTPMHRRLFEDGKVTMELKPYADAMKAIAAEKGIQCIDLHELSGNFYQEKGDDPLEEFFGVDDRTHFSEKGARLMAKLLVEALAEKTCELSKYLK